MKLMQVSIEEAEAKLIEQMAQEQRRPVSNMLRVIVKKGLSTV
jgi:hypothetical protein